MLLTVIFDCLQNIREHKTKQRLSRHGVRLLKRCQIIVPQLDTLTVEARGVRKEPNAADFDAVALYRWHRRHQRPKTANCRMSRSVESTSWKERKHDNKCSSTRCPHLKSPDVGRQVHLCRMRPERFEFQDWINKIVSAEVPGFGGNERRQQKARRLRAIT